MNRKAQRKLRKLTRGKDPGIHGNFADTCTVCLRPTDTGLAFSGEAEWAISGLMHLGIPEDEAMATVSLVMAEGLVPEVAEDTGMFTFRVCGKCASKKGLTVGLLVDGNPIPVYAVPDELKERMDKEEAMLHSLEREAGLDTGSIAEGSIELSRIRVEERPGAWPDGAQEVVRRFLVEDYDPATMPTLIACPRAEDRGTPNEGDHYVVGWAWEGSPYPALMDYLDLRRES